MERRRRQPLRPRGPAEGRDLRPTIGLDALAARACAETFGIDPARASQVLFPDMRGAPRVPQPLRA